MPTRAPCAPHPHGIGWSQGIERVTVLLRKYGGLGVQELIDMNGVVCTMRRLCIRPWV